MTSQADKPPAKRRKIAILGGGMGGVAAAFALTNDPDWKKKYEIDLYTLGWQLGGKGASWRHQKEKEEETNPYRDRIEEHGLHVWMGFYENAFAMIRRCYDELDRSTSLPLATWDRAFFPHSVISLAQKEGKEWQFWKYRFPTNSDTPGDGHDFPSVWSYFEMLMELLLDVLDDFERNGSFPWSGDKGCSPLRGCQQIPGCNRAGSWLSRHFGRLQSTLFRQAYKLLKVMPKEPTLALLRGYDTLLDQMMALVKRRQKSPQGAQNRDVEQTIAALDFGIALARGLLADGALEKGFDALDQREFRDWLRSHGLSQSSHPIVNGMYSLLLAYEGGNPRNKRLSAAVATRFILRMGFSYKGAIFWKMKAGMGETVFAPLYLVLKERGVRFHFFHRVDELTTTQPGAREIAAIKMTRLAKPKATYDPLIAIDGLPCWRQHPDFDELVDGDKLKDELKEREGSLASHWMTHIEGQESITLTPEASDEALRFDDAILAIPVGALGAICQPLILADRRWDAMIKGLKTTRTQSLQLWLNKPLNGLRSQTDPTVMTNFSEPLHTYADLSHLATIEGWKPADGVRHVAYFCGPMLDDPNEPPKQGQPAYATGQQAVAYDYASHWAERNLPLLFPRALRRGQFDWGTLVDLRAGDHNGIDRLKSQYWRANVEPSDRYVLSVPGSLKVRMYPGESGFRNLFLAGDWTRTGLDCGCIEAAVMSGKQAARALTQRYHGISGEDDL